jgi:hypothetical protein
MITPSAQTQPQQPPAFEGRIANPDPDALTVVIDAFDGDAQGRHEWGPCVWMPRGHELPARGDRCLVILSDTRSPWVVAWPGPVPAPPAPLTELLATKPSPGWTTPTLAANWVDYGAEDASFRVGWHRDPFGAIWLRGIVRRTASTWTPNMTMFTLPPGSRPQQRHMFAVFGYANSVPTYMRVDVDTAGNVMFVFSAAPWSGTVNLVGLDNVRFLLP